MAPVDRALFEGPEGEKRLADLAWLAPRALHHQDVLAACQERGAVLPARFGTLFSTEESLCAFLGRHAPSISAFLRESRDHEEWGLKGILDRPRALEACIAAARSERTDLAAMGPGRLYLEERRLAADAERELSAWAARAGEEVTSLLAPLAARSVERRPVPAADPQEGEAVFSRAFLVCRGSRDAFLSAVREAGSAWEGEGLRLEASGPWPPYSFAPPLQD